MHHFKLRMVLLVVLGVLTIPKWAFSQSEEINLERIVVTPLRYGQEIGEVGSSVTVITEDEIKNSNADNIIDILELQTNVEVNDFYGNSAKAQVDIRGFGGEMAALNNLVLVDGRRVNEVDLSGVDWTQIPLNQVEKIEIVRGGSGAVLYGDNAVSGVINIITKRGAGKPHLEFGSEIGSYDLNSQSLSLKGASNGLSYVLSASRQSTNGYRKNSFFKSVDFSNKLEYEVQNLLKARFSFGYHRASYGLPGSLTESDIANFGRRHSKYGGDHGLDKDYYFLIGVKKEFEGTGALDFDLSYRNKFVFSDLMGGNGGFNPFRKSPIKTIGFTPKFKVDRDILGRKNNFITGIDLYRQQYKSKNFNSANVIQDFTHINKTSLGVYMQDELEIINNLKVIGGFRYERQRYAFNFHDYSGWYSDVDKNITPNRKDYNSGFVYNYAQDSSIFASYNQSFRFPATDEFFSGTLNTDLKPQISRNYEVGIRHRFNVDVGIEFSVFNMDVENELYTDPTAFGGLGATANYSKTRHEGLEFGSEFRIIKNLKLTGNYSLSRATFRGGPFSGNDIPMIPNHKANIGIQFQPLKEVTLSVTENYTGHRYRLNDVTNTRDYIKQHFTTDMAIFYSKNDLTVSLRINNLFNEYYYDFASYGVFSGKKVYYPAPGRNFSLKLEYRF
ncbi:MAG: TonB-dependent receptor [Candidatus Omnitrophica bacterium]|nr:TonB-dependent receptor [Candidatus Omnitrophota bacterium]